jgi:phenylpyruvate tautomerase PptA (4-oxalocrotonate tautomerase family)
MTRIMIAYAARHKDSPHAGRTKEKHVPIFEVTYPEGALSPEARDELMEGLTTALLRAERAPDTEFFRNITWSYVHELPEGSVRAAGIPVSEPTFRIDVTTPEGALSDRRRAELVTEATRVVREVTGIAEEDSLRIWVLMHEVAEGRWGAAGNVVQFKNLLEAAKHEREKADQPVAAGS